MTGFIEHLKAGHLIAGLVVMALGGVAALVRWLDRRQAASADRIKTDFGAQSERYISRLRTVEESISRIESDLGEIDDRVQHVEKSMETVARAKDVAEVREQLAELRAESRKTSGMVDTIYRAAIRAGSADGGS